MGRNVPEKIKTKGGHQPRARIHAGWSPIGQHHRRVALLRGLGVLLAVVLVLGFAVDAYAQSFFDSLPSIRGLDSAAFAGDTLISDRNGKELADVGYHTGDHRLAVRLKDVNPNMINATIAIEDKNFYSNPGFDTMAILRALYDDLRTGHIVSGASTITQQLAKQQFLTPDQTYSRKIKELALAYELSQTYTRPDTRAVPQQKLLWRPVVRRRSGRAELLPHLGQQAGSRPGNDSRRPSAGADPVQPGPEPGRGQGAPEAGPGRDGARVRRHESHSSNG